MHERDERRKVLLSARMLCDKGWSEVTVGNLSRRGMMIVAEARLKPGSCIEIRRARYTIVGRIVWAEGGRVGLRAQDPIDVPGLIAAAAGAVSGGAGSAGGGHGGGWVERRLVDRVEERRLVASRLQYISLLVLTTVGAWLIADAMGLWLAAPLKLVRRALGSPE